MAEDRPNYMKDEGFARYFETAHADGALDAKTKELMHLALVLAFHCEP